MDRAGHYREAERLAGLAADSGNEQSMYNRERYGKLAQVHATLATAPAEVEAEATARDRRAADRAERAEWAATLTAEAAKRAQS
jgi:hypothetical protein